MQSQCMLVSQVRSRHNTNVLEKYVSLILILSGTKIFVKFCECAEMFLKMLTLQ